MPVVSRTWLETPHTSAVRLERRRNGGTCATEPSAHSLPYVLGQWAGEYGMSKATTTIPTTRIFGGCPEEVRNVREFVTQAVGGCPVAYDVTLLASELAANAIRHTASGRGN